MFFNLALEVNTCWQRLAAMLAGCHVKFLVPGSFRHEDAFLITYTSEAERITEKENC